MIRFKLDQSRWFRNGKTTNSNTKFGKLGGQNKKLTPTLLMWAGGKTLTTIFSALICGVGLGMLIGYWLHPNGNNKPVSIQLLPPQSKNQNLEKSRDIFNDLSELPSVVSDLSESSRFLDGYASISPKVNALPPAGRKLRTKQSSTTRPQWLENAATSPKSFGLPMIAIVIDDVGVDQTRSRRAIALSGPLTIAVMSYARNIEAYAEAVIKNGHELIVHVPMEPINIASKAGPNALLTSLDENEIMHRLNWALTRFDGYVGISNHMGSRFSTFGPGMRIVLGEINRRGLLYLDSRTTSNSLAEPVARSLGMPFATRDVFLDNDPSPVAVRRQIVELEELAMRQGYAVGIGHPHDATIKVLGDWLLDFNRRGFVLVPISEIVRHRLSES